MKKIILFIILTEVLLSLTISIERNNNSIIPYNLRLGSNETLLSISSDYDTLTHKYSLSTHLHVYIKILSKKTQKTNKTQKKYLYSYQFKSRVGIKLHNKKPFVELKNSYKLNYKKFTLYEEITPAIPLFYKETTTLEYKQNNKLFFINKSFIYKKAGMNYSFGIDFYQLFLPKFVRTITITLSGNTSQNPFIYSYKLSTSYRFSIMNKKYFYLNINPYILIAKNYNFKIKPALKISINYNF